MNSLTEYKREIKSSKPGKQTITKIIRILGFSVKESVLGEQRC